MVIYVQRWFSRHATVVASFHLTVLDAMNRGRLDQRRVARLMSLASQGDCAYVITMREELERLMR